jgi:hypothetical protein
LEVQSPRLPPSPLIWLLERGDGGSTSMREHVCGIAYNDKQEVRERERERENMNETEMP